MILDMDIVWPLLGFLSIPALPALALGVITLMPGENTRKKEARELDRNYNRYQKIREKYGDGIKDSIETILKYSDKAKRDFNFSYKPPDIYPAKSPPRAPCMRELRTYEDDVLSISVDDLISDWWLHGLSGSSITVKLVADDTIVYRYCKDTGCTHFRDGKWVDHLFEAAGPCLKKEWERREKERRRAEARAEKEDSISIYDGLSSFCVYDPSSEWEERPSTYYDPITDMQIGIVLSHNNDEDDNDEGL